MLTMSITDKKSTSRKDFGEKKNALKDTNNVNNVEYVTSIQTIQAGNRVPDHLYWKTEHHFPQNYHRFLTKVLLQNSSLFK